MTVARCFTALCIFAACAAPHAARPAPCAVGSRLLMAQRSGADTFQLGPRAGAMAGWLALGTEYTGDVPEHGFSAFQLSDGRFVLDQLGATAYFLYDPTVDGVTALGDVELVEAPGLGMAFERFTSGGIIHVYDVAPDRKTPRLRELWHGVATSVELEPVGTFGGAEAIVVRTVDANRRHGPTATLVTTCGDAVVARALVLPTELAPVFGDAIRDHRMLLVAPYVGQSETAYGFHSAVAILDLDSGALRPIGMAIGTLAHIDSIAPMLDVEWSDHRPRGGLIEGEQPWLNLVDVTTEALTALR